MNLIHSCIYDYDEIKNIILGEFKEFYPIFDDFLNLRMVRDLTEVVDTHITFLFSESIKMFDYYPSFHIHNEKDALYPNKDFHFIGEKTIVCRRSVGSINSICEDSSYILSDMQFINIDKEKLCNYINNKNKNEFVYIGCIKPNSLVTPLFFIIYKYGEYSVCLIYPFNCSIYSATLKFNPYDECSNLIETFYDNKYIPEELYLKIMLEGIENCQFCITL